MHIFTVFPCPDIFITLINLFLIRLPFNTMLTVRVVSGLSYREDCKSALIDLRALTVPCLYLFACLVYVRENLMFFFLLVVHSLFGLILCRLVIYN